MVLSSTLKKALKVVLALMVAVPLAMATGASGAADQAQPQFAQAR